MKQYIVLFLLLFFILSGFKSEPWRYNQIGNSDGLSNSAVTSIFMDSQGFMWFGTWDGLNRYDGSHIKVFKPDVFQKGSISNNIIRSIIEDKYQQLWIVTEDGLNLYDFHDNLFTPFLQNEVPKEYRENRFHVVLDSDSIIWCSKYDYGISYFDEHKHDFSDPVEVEGDPECLKKAVGFTVTDQKHLWVIDDEGTVSGLYKDGVWRIIKEYHLLEHYKFDPCKNWFVTLDDKTTLFLALKNGGLIELNMQDGSVREYLVHDQDFNVTSLSMSLHDSILWGGTDEGRVFQLSLTNEWPIKFIDHQLNGFSNKQIKIWSITETEPDLLWIGTDGDGVYKYIKNGNYFESIGKGDLSKGCINHNIVRAIHEDPKGNIWVGTRGNGLNFIPSTGFPTQIYDLENGLSNNAVLALSADTYGNIWIGIDGEGIDMYEVTTGKILHFPRDFVNEPLLDFGSVYAICLDSFGELWIGTSGYGLLRFSIKKNSDGQYVLEQFRHYQSKTDSENGVQSNVIYSIVEGRPNVIWIGTRGGGLYRFNTLTEKFESFQSRSEDTNCLNNNDVLSLMKSGHQELWIGTSGGLNRLNLATTPYQFSHITERDGLSNNTIHSIFEDENNNVWVSTNRGLSKFNVEEGEVRNYFKSDGLQSDEYTDGASCIGLYSGLFYVGGVNGFDRFNPAQIKDSDYFPRLAITEFSLFNQKGENSDTILRHVDLLDSLVLQYDQNFFNINFTTLNYHNKEKCKYAYQLENFDADFIHLDKAQKITFTNVPPGEYLFKIKWTNEDGVWNPAVREVHIVILPPFWKTTGAYFLYVFLVLAVLYFIAFSIKRRALIRHKIVLERMENQKIKEMNQYKFQFFTNIAHEFRTPLTLIMAPVAQLMDMKSEDPKIVPYVQSIYNNATRLLHLIRELIDFRKVETGNFKLKVKNENLTRFVSTIVDAFVQYASQKKIELNFSKGEDDIEGWFDSGIMEKVLLNIVSNALKYTDEKGTVSIGISTESQCAIINIKDSGRGISSEYKQKIFNRFFQESDSSVQGKEQADSAGVGLSLTKSLVELHKGSIKVESTYGVGSCFTVTIPISGVNYSEEEKRMDMLIDEALIRDRATEEFAGLELVDFNHEGKKLDVLSDVKETVLVVDDNAQLRNLICDILHDQYQIVEAANGIEALELLKRFDVSVVLSDVIMPEMDGMVLCRKIKENIETCHIPVIILTAKGELEHRIEGIESGADSYIPKPFDPRHLKVRIRKLIENRVLIQRSLQMLSSDSTKSIEGLNSRDAELLDRLNDYMNKNIDNEELDADDMASHLNMSKTQLYRKIKALTGFTPHGLLKNVRLKKAVLLLKESNRTVSEIIYEIGFKNRTYFYRSFKELYGASPMDYLKNISDE